MVPGYVRDATWGALGFEDFSGGMSQGTAVYVLHNVGTLELPGCNWEPAECDRNIIVSIRSRGEPGQFTKIF